MKPSNTKSFLATIGIMILSVAILTALLFGGAELYKSLSGKNTSEQSNQSEALEDSQEILSDTNVTVTTNESSVNSDVPTDLQAFIEDYFKQRYMELGTLTYSSMSSFYNMDDRAGATSSYAMNTSLQFLINVRKERSNDLGFSKAEVGITYKDYEKSGDKLTVVFDLNDALDFNYLDGITSYSCGMEQTITVVKSGDSYKIVQHIEETDVNFLVGDAFDAMVEEKGIDLDTVELTKIDSMYEEIRLTLQEQAKNTVASQQEELDKYNANPENYLTQKTADNEYDRENAVKYSYQWVDKVNVIRTDEYPSYDVYGGNCQNYASQCILAGGVPMDYTGSAALQWKWYGDTNDSSESATGRSSSWAGTEYFFEYAKSNTGSGMVADVSGNVYSGNIGDIMQYVVDDWAEHTVIITKVIKDSEGNVVDYLINSNTTDRIDFPLSAYGYTDYHLIKILGWNN